MPVPNDPTQVMYVWVDALSNYITALGYETGGELLDRYWTNNPQRVHVVGKDIIRFHVIYWPALLLSAGLPLPTTVNVHEFLMVDGERISKSRGNTVDPIELVGLYGNDALRYWLLREMPRTGDGNFSQDRLVSRFNEDLGNDLGNLVNRAVSMLHRYRGGVVPSIGADDARDATLREIADGIPSAIDDALAAFDFRRAIAAVWELVTAANRYVDDSKPWELAKAAKAGDDDANRRLDGVLADLIETIRLLSVHLTPFIPLGAAKIASQVGDEPGPVPVRTWTDALAGRTLPKAAPIFPRIESPEPVPA